MYPQYSKNIIIKNLNKENFRNKVKTKNLGKNVDFGGN
jgi:hypothetical protein